MDATLNIQTLPIQPRRAACPNSLNFVSGMAEHRATAALAKPHRRHGNRPYLDSITGTGGVAQLSLLGGQKFALRFAPCPLAPNNGKLGGASEFAFGYRLAISPLG